MTYIKRKIKRRSAYEIVKMYQLRQLGWTLQRIANEFSVYPAVVWDTLNNLKGRISGRFSYRNSYGDCELFNQAYDLAAKIVKQEVKI